MLPPTESRACWSDDSPSTARRTGCALKPSGPRKLKSTVFEEVTVALVTIKNCRRYEWMLAKRALHSASDWLMCRVFCNSMVVGFLLRELKQRRCHWLLRGRKPGSAEFCVKFVYTCV